MQLDLIAGARPNFVKLAALIHAIENFNGKVEYRLIHTGQHYDESLSGNFFHQLELPLPHFNLHVGSGSQAQQMAGIILGYEKLLTQSKPDFCIVVGDVTSSMACAITAKKLQVKVAHVEAGIRSRDWTMPEEVNRVLIDSIADQFFTTTQCASKNLLQTGIAKEKVHFVGNTMIDTLFRFRSRFKKPIIWKKLNLLVGNYIILTLHRPDNVDEAHHLKKLIIEIVRNSKNMPIIFPVHPRTSEILKGITLPLHLDNLHFISPLGYLEFNYLVAKSKAVITDSGGISEEATVLGVPCITIRENTERPETVEIGTNELIGTNPKALAPVLKKLLEENWKKGKIPKLWDGNAGDRIIQIMTDLQY